MTSVRLGGLYSGHPSSVKAHSLAGTNTLLVKGEGDRLRYPQDGHRRVVSGRNMYDYRKITFVDVETDPEKGRRPPTSGLWVPYGLQSPSPLPFYGVEEWGSPC